MEPGKLNITKDIELPFFNNKNYNKNTFKNKEVVLVKA
jgi:hypothetical protein